MLIVETIARIRREHFIKGKTIKEIARDLKVSRNSRLNAPMSGNDLVIVIDQNGVVEAEPLDAARDLLDLLRRVGTRIARIGSQRMGRPVFEIHFRFSVEWKNLDRNVDRLGNSPSRTSLFYEQTAS